MRFVEKMPRKKKIIAKKTQVCVLASPSRLPDADDVKLPMPRTPPRAHSPLSEEQETGDCRDSRLESRGEIENIQQPRKRKQDTSMSDEQETAEWNTEEGENTQQPMKRKREKLMMTEHQENVLFV